MFHIHYEIECYFAWIFSSMLFLAYHYLFKFQSQWKITIEKYQLCDMFKQKSQLDHLHYYKFEHDCFCVIISFAFLMIKAIFADTNMDVKKVFYNKDAAFPISTSVLRILSAFFFIRLCTSHNLIGHYCHCFRGRKKMFMVAVAIIYIGLIIIIALTL